LWRASEGLKLNFLPTYNCDNQTGYQKTYHVETQNSPPTIVMMVSLFTKHSQQQKQMSVQLFPPYGSFTSEFKCLMSPAIAWEKNTTKNTGISWQWTNNSPASNYGSSLNSAITAKLLVLQLTWTAHQDHPLPLALAHLLALFACPPLVQFRQLWTHSGINLNNRNNITCHKDFNFKTAHKSSNLPFQWPLIT
jgi:hypothetical protein